MRKKAIERHEVRTWGGMLLPILKRYRRNNYQTTNNEDGN